MVVATAATNPNDQNNIQSLSAENLPALRITTRAFPVFLLGVTRSAESHA